MNGTIRTKTVTTFAMGVVAALLAAVVVTQAWQVDAAPGDDDMTFVALTDPCRLADTRSGDNRIGSVGTIGEQETETFEARGENGECEIADDAEALLLNVTALGATQQSFLTFWPEGERPLAASLNPAAGQPPAPNAVTVGLSSDGSFEVYNDKGDVNIVVDVTGYYIKSSLKELSDRVAALEAQIAALPSFPTCTGDPVSSSLDLDVANYDLRMTGGTPGEPAVYSGQILARFDVVDGDVNPSEVTSQNNNSPMSATGTVTGDFGATPQEFGMTWSPSNRGVFEFTDVKMDGDDFCGVYTITGDGPDDFGTFTMTKSS